MAEASTADDKGLHLLLKGGAALRDGTGALHLLSPFDAALLAYLAIQGPTPRRRLLELFWPEQPIEDARNAFRQRLFRLRKGLGAELVHGAELLSLAPGVGHDIGQGEGELLAGHAYAESPELDRWLAVERQKAQAQREARLDALEGEGRLADAAVLAERALAADRHDESAARRLMRLHYLQGDRRAALDVYERFRSALDLAVGAEPAAATRELAQTLRASDEMPLPPGRRVIPASVLRPPRVIGRDAERALLGDAWAQGRAFWLVGEAGVGKSRLLELVVDEALADSRAEGTLVFQARPGDTGVPYASLARALRALLARQPGLLDRAPDGALALMLPELAGAGGNPAGARSTPEAALEVLFREAERGGLAAVVVDDLHHADDASLEMLQHLALGDGSGRLRWGFAQRPAEGAARLDSLAGALAESHRLEFVTLAPLDESQIVELVASLGVASLDADALAPLLLRHTGGNPLYALETIKHLIAAGPPSVDAALPRPASVGHLIERRLRQLSPPALALARVAAVAGVDFSIEMAEEVLATRPLWLADAWHELETAQVLRDRSFAHDLVHEAALAGIPAPIAASTHGAVAAFLEARGGEPARIASHWLAAGKSARAAIAFHAASVAARRAMRRKEEAAFLSRAAEIEASSGNPAAFATLREMIEALWVADRVALDATVYDRLEAYASTPQEHAIAYATRATWAHGRNDIESAKRLCARAIEIAEGAGDEATAAETRKRLSLILHFCGDFEGALGLMQPLVPWFSAHGSDAERIDFYGDLASVLDNVDRGREARAWHARAIELGRQAGAWSDVLTIQINLAISWANAGFMTRAVELLQEALQLAAAHDEVRGSASTLPIELHNALRDSGRYGDALRWIEPALFAADGQLASWKPLVRCHVACSWIHLGQHARAQREVDAALAADLPGWIRAKALQMRGRMRLALGLGASEPLAQAAAEAPSEGRRYLRASIGLDHALSMDPAEALAVARAVIAEGERLDLPGIALAGHIRGMRFAVAAGATAAAKLHAEGSIAIGEEISPNDLYPAERWLNEWQALSLCGQATAARASLERGAAWVQRALREQVPEAFRDSFVRANPVNQQLLRATQKH